MESKTVHMAVVGLLAALLCVAGPIVIVLPFTPVPVSLINFVLFFFLYVFEWKKGMQAYLIYLLLGFSGIPVFSKGQAGASVLFGPTGGFLMGFLLMILFSGWMIQKGGGKRIISIAGLFAGMMLSYLFGLIWFSVQMKTDIKAAFFLCVLPFLPIDMIKICVVAAVGPEIKKRLSFFN